MIGFLGAMLCSTALSAPPPGPDEVKELQARFTEGRHELEAGHCDKALQLFQANLNRDPDSKGSLLFSGLARMELGQWEQAAENLEHFLGLEPASEAGLTAAIRARQALGQEAEVEALRTRLRQERDAGKNPRLKAMLSYERQFEILPDGSRFSALEAFDEQTGYVWSYFLIKPDHKIYRRLEMAPAHAGDARVKFMLGEMLGEAQKITGYKIHRLYPDKPSFTRAWQDARQVIMEGSAARK